MKVAKHFRDRYTNRFYKEGEPYPQTDGDRVSYLLKKGFLEEKSKQPPKREEPEKKKSPSKKKTKKAGD